MTPHPIARAATGWSLVLAPLAGLIGAVATPALRSNRTAELAAATRHHDRFYVYAIAVLISSYLFVPAFFALMALIREWNPRWAYLAGGLAQVGMIVAIGDAATELMYWQMASPDADRGQMTALADRYESTTGSSLVYTVGGFAVLVGTLGVAVALWRGGVAPRWAAAGVAVGVIANVVGFSSASQPVLVGSYLIMVAALGRIAALVLGRRGARPDDATPATGRRAATAGR